MSTEYYILNHRTKQYLLGTKKYNTVAVDDLFGTNKEVAEKLKNKLRLNQAVGREYCEMYYEWAAEKILEFVGKATAEEVEILPDDYGSTKNYLCFCDLYISNQDLFAWRESKQLISCITKLNDLGISNDELDEVRHLFESLREGLYNRCSVHYHINSSIQWEIDRRSKLKIIELLNEIWGE